MKLAELFVSNHIEIGSKAFIEESTREFGLSKKIPSYEELDKDELKEHLKGIQNQIQKESQKQKSGMIRYPRLFLPPSVEYFKDCVKSVLEMSPAKKRLILF